MEKMQKGFPLARLDSMSAAAKNKDTSATAPKWVFPRMDATDNLYVARQLEEIRAGLYEIQYPALKAKGFLRFNTSIDPGVNQYTVRAIDRAGTPKLIMPGKSRDIPNVELKVTSGTIDFRSWAMAYSFDKQEMAAARYAGLPLDAMKAAACREIMAAWMDRFALIGDVAATSTDSYVPQGSGVVGFFKLSGTQTYTPTTDGLAGSKAFTAKASDAIINDMGHILTQCAENSLGIETTDTCLMPLATRNYLLQKRVGDGTSVSVMTYLRDNNADVTFDWSSYLATAGTSFATRIVAYRNDPGVAEMLISQEFEQNAPQWDELNLETICTMRTAGVAGYRPNAILFADAA